MTRVLGLLLMFTLVCPGATTSVGAPAAHELQTPGREGKELKAKTEPLDLDGNGHYEWLSVRFRLPVSNPPTYEVFGDVAIPTGAGVADDLVYFREWDWERGSWPHLKLKCDPADCWCEVWLSGRHLAQAVQNRPAVVSLYAGGAGGAFDRCVKYKIIIRRNDWGKFEWSGRDHRVIQELPATTEPLDLDHNGRYEWLSVRFSLPVPGPGAYDVIGSVGSPSDSGIASDVAYPRGWGLNRASIPVVHLHCDTTACPAEVWLNGRNLAQAFEDRPAVLSIEAGQPGQPWREYTQYVIMIRRGDWARFEAGEGR